MVTDLISRELASDTGISILYFRIVPGYRGFLAFCTKSPPLSTTLNIDTMCISPEFIKS